MEKIKKRKRRTLTGAEMVEAVKTSNGFITVAAEKLGICRQTFYEKMDDFPEVREAIKDTSEKMLDLAENQLVRLILSGDLQAIMFYLRTKGKHRGYTEKIESELSGRVEVAAVPVIRFENTTPELPGTMIDNS